ncbi:hypothetical protein Tco_0412272 [Tanacetum coccineum]
MALDSTKFLCTAITKVPLLYSTTTSNTQDPSILTSDAILSMSKWKMGWLSYTSSKQNISCCCDYVFICYVVRSMALCSIGVVYVVRSMALCSIGGVYVVRSMALCSIGGVLSSLISLNRGSFDVIIGMDWLSKRKFVIVCHEKVVGIPLEGDEILQVHGERTQEVVKTLVNTKTRVSYDLVIFREEHQCRLLRREAWSSFEVSVGITEEGEVVTYLRFIANFSKIVKPLTSLTERNQKYEWGAEREEAF